VSDDGWQRITVTLGPGRTARLALPDDITAPEIDRIVDRLAEIPTPVATATASPTEE
jgi:hypothetical protein